MNTTPNPTDPAIVTRGLVRTFNKLRAVDGIERMTEDLLDRRKESLLSLAQGK